MRQEHDSGSHDLVSFLKVFDVNYASDTDCREVSGLDVNHPADVAKAVRLLLVPQLRLYSPAELRHVMKLLNERVDGAGTADDVVARIGLVFDGEVVDHRAFLRAVRDALAVEHLLL
jgi:hypothetical protein